MARLPSGAAPPVGAGGVSNRLEGIIPDEDEFMRELEMDARRGEEANGRGGNGHGNAGGGYGTGRFSTNLDLM